MGEHVHEWRFHPNIKEHDGGTFTFGYVCQRRTCGEVMYLTESERRLNATEELSAATAIGASVTVSAERQSKALLAYAAALEENRNDS